MIYSAIQMAAFIIIAIAEPNPDLELLIQQTFYFSPNIQARGSKMLIPTMCFSPNIQARDSKMLTPTMCFSPNIQARDCKMLILTMCFSPNIHATDNKMLLITMLIASGRGLQHADCQCISLVFKADGQQAY